MKIKHLITIIILVMGMMACSDFPNPVSSDNHSGVSENGSGVSENGSGVSENG